MPKRTKGYPRLACKKGAHEVWFDMLEMHVLKGETGLGGGLLSQANPSGKLAAQVEIRLDKKIRNTLIFVVLFSGSPQNLSGSGDND